MSGSTPLTERPQGQKLLAALRPGDAIATSKLDRMFRSASDALATLESFKEQGIGLHMIDLGATFAATGSASVHDPLRGRRGRRDRIRERIRDVKRHLASQGVYGGGKRPFGFDVVDKRLVANEA